MESTWTVRSYLESQRVKGLKWSEKNLRDDIGTFLGRGEAVNRAVAQYLRVILLKTRKVSILLESDAEVNISSYLTFLPELPTYLTFLPDLPS